MDNNKRTFIVAEAGINHNGSMFHAHRMIEKAKDAGVDAIKFQTHFGFPGQEQYEFTKFVWDTQIFRFCRDLDLKWFSTPFDFKSIDFLKECGMDIWKIPSGMLTNKKYLTKIKELKPNWWILSTGMASWEEVLSAVHFLAIIDDVVRRQDVLYCVTAYPTPYNEIDLNILQQDYFTGLSDHTLGIEIPIAAVAMGASVIEKHFTLSRDMEGPDHKASLEPHELREMVRCIRNVEAAMGDGIKQPTPSELKVRDEIRGLMERHC